MKWATILLVLTDARLELVLGHALGVAEVPGTGGGVVVRGTLGSVSLASAGTASVALSAADPALALEPLHRVDVCPRPPGAALPSAGRPQLQGSVWAAGAAAAGAAWRGNGGGSGKAAPASAGDCQALQGLYSATAGPGWVWNGNWSGTVGCCSWYGVSCSADGNATRLQLDGNNLDGTLPNSIGLLSALRGLYLDKNALTGILPSVLFTAGYLCAISVQYNRLQGQIPQAFSAWPADNCFGGSGFWGLELQVAYNNLSGTLPAFPLELSGIWAESNTLSGTIPDLP
eukprot:gene7420-6960_t